MAAAPPGLGKRESEFGSSAVLPMSADESETQIATIMHNMMAAQKVVRGKSQKATCCWSEEDPKIEVARRKLEQGGIALFIRQQHAKARRKRPPLRIWIPQKIRRSWSKFQSRGYVFRHDSPMLHLWEWSLAYLVLALSIFIPILVAFHDEKELLLPFHGEAQIALYAVDALFIIDMCFKFRTAFKFEGVVVLDRSRIARRYLESWFVPDLISVVVPLGGLRVQELKIFYLLRFGRLMWLVRKLTRLGRGTNYVRLSVVMGGFALMAHWFGLIWYYAFSTTVTKQIDNIDEVGGATRYMCCLYYAMAVMTQLKDEARLCLAESAERPDETTQRWYVISTFLFGVMATSVIFGTIAELVTNLGQASIRYSKQIDALNELFHFHNLPKALQDKVRDHVDTEFALTRGIDVAQACSALPPRLQIEIFFHLNRKQVLHVPLFARLPTEWVDAMVMQLQFSFFSSSAIVIEEGKVTECCYFVKRGILQSVHDELVMNTYTENAYFGDVRALFTEPSLVEVRAVTDSMLLTMSSQAVELVNDAFPEVSKVFQQIRRLRKRAARTDPTAASGLQSVEQLLRKREYQEREAVRSRSSKAHNGNSLRAASRQWASNQFGAWFSSRSKVKESQSKVQRLASLLSVQRNNTASSKGAVDRQKTFSSARMATILESKRRNSSACGHDGGEAGPNTTPDPTQPTSQGAHPSDKQRRWRVLLSPRGTTRVAPEDKYAVADGEPQPTAHDGSSLGYEAMPTSPADGAPAAAAVRFASDATRSSQCGDQQIAAAIQRASSSGVAFDVEGEWTSTGSGGGGGCAGGGCMGGGAVGGAGGSAALSAASVQQLGDLITQRIRLEFKHELDAAVGVLRTEQQALLGAIARDLRKNLATSAAAGVDHTMLRVYPFLHSEVHAGAGGALG